jgi:hypothetical protein
MEEPRCSACGSAVLRPETGGDLVAMPRGRHSGVCVDLLVKADPCTGLDSPSDGP